MMFKATSDLFCTLMERYMPDPFLFASILTILVYCLALVVTPVKSLDLIDMWSKGLWVILEFTAQMVVCLIASAAVVRTKPVEKVLSSIGRTVRTPSQAYFLTSLVAGIGALLSFAVGLVMGAFFAKQMARDVKGCHYPLLVASGYSGFLIWHMGYGATIPLMIATPGNFTEKIIGQLIPVSETLLSPMNIITAAVLLIATAFLMPRLKPAPEKVVEIDPSLLKENVDRTSGNPKTSVVSLAKRIEFFRPINIILAAGGFIYLAKYFANGESLTLNTMNLTLFSLALLLNKSPIEFIRNCKKGGEPIGPIAIQFPMYGGIMGIMIYSGLATVIADLFVSVSTQVTLPIFTFLSAGLINLFVPSGGGQWAVQGPVMIKAANAMGTEPAIIAMAVAWGDQWTNMIQPFWALPLLSIAGLKARSMMGYCVVTLLVTGAIMLASLVIFPLIF